MLNFHVAIKLNRKYFVSVYAGTRSNQAQTKFGIPIQVSKILDTECAENFLLVAVSIHIRVYANASDLVLFRKDWWCGCGKKKKMVSYPFGEWHCSHCGKRKHEDELRTGAGNRLKAKRKHEEELRTGAGNRLKELERHRRHSMQETGPVRVDGFRVNYDSECDAVSLKETSEVSDVLVTFLSDFRTKCHKHLSKKYCANLRKELSEKKVSLLIEDNEQYYMVKSVQKSKIIEDDGTRISEFSKHSFPMVISDEGGFDARKIDGEAPEELYKDIGDSDGPEELDNDSDDADYLKYRLVVKDDVSESYPKCTINTNINRINVSWLQDFFNAREIPSPDIDVKENICPTVDAETNNGALKNGLRVKDEPSSTNDLRKGFPDDDTDMASLRSFDLPPPRWIDRRALDILVYRIEEPLMSVIEKLASPDPPTPHVSMRYELLRLCTLRSYPMGDKPYLIKLAAAGFYYASDGDGVVCYCCGSRHYDWTGKDDPMKVHQRIKKNCKFLIKNDEVNVPVEFVGPLTETVAALDDIPAPSSDDGRKDSGPVENTASQETPEHEQTLGINNPTPKHPNYCLKTERIKSFENGWPKESRHTPSQLAEAGFFFAGFGDCVRCFFCGIGLRHWSPEDDPFIEHARWARTCVFIKQKKGQDFVNLVQFAVQLNEENGGIDTTHGKSISVDVLEKLMLTKAAQRASEMGFTVKVIRQAVETLARSGVTDNINPDELLATILRLEDQEEISSAPAVTKPIVVVRNDTTAPRTQPKLAIAVKDSVKGASGTNGSNNKEERSNTGADANEKLTGSGKSNDSDASMDPATIKKENEELKEQTLCKVCLDNMVCIVFLPCGHLVTCADCAPAMRKCPICRTLVQGTVRTYMS